MHKQNLALLFITFKQSFFKTTCATTKIYKEIWVLLLALKPKQ